MTIEGVDYSWSRPNLSCLYNNGKRFICRYFSFDTTGKTLSPTEAKNIAASGLWIVANWEQSGKGDTHPDDAARQSLKIAHDVNMPHGRPIYASADFDIQDYNYDEAQNWITSFHKALGGEYDGRALYSHCDMLEWGYKHGWLKWGWNTYAWSGGQWCGDAQLQQYQNGVTLCSGSVDLDRAMVSDYGQWQPGKLPPNVTPEDDDMPDQYVFQNVKQVSLKSGDWVTLKWSKFNDPNSSGTSAVIPGRFYVATLDIGIDKLPADSNAYIRYQCVDHSSYDEESASAISEQRGTSGSTSLSLTRAAYCPKNQYLRARVAASVDCKLTSATWSILYW